jgi:3-dehydroquinate synthase
MSVISNRYELHVRWVLERRPATVVVTTQRGNVDSGDASLEASLGWPAGTLAYLRQGFAARLPRSTGWQGPSNDPAWEVAAAYFRRGVPSSAQSGKTKRATRGQYSISVNTSSELATERFVRPGDYVLLDSEVAKAWPALRGEFVWAASESAKQLSAVAAMLAAQPKAARQWTIIGGGILGDVAGFAATVAGKSFRYVPTTLLAMVDACIGGKTGVNFPPYGKNQVGAFAFPTAVDIEPGFLSTLPPRELVAGLAECVKHCLIAGDLALAKKLDPYLAGNNAALSGLAELLPALIRIKAEIVERDPDEQGERAVLNFGHTLAHALEGLFGDRGLLHGEAVAIGLQFALAVSQAKAGFVDEKLAAPFVAPLWLAALKQNPEVVSFLRASDSWQRLLPLFAQDKKNIGDDAVAGFVLLKAIGKPTQPFVTQVSLKELEPVWQAFRTDVLSKLS